MNDTLDTDLYRYNARSELTSAIAIVDAAYRYGYNFDDIGNRKSSAERRVWSSEYTANNLSQYTTITSQTARASEAFRNYYDADGNQIRVKTATGTWQIAYNGENRLVRWQQGPTVITMSFDRMGRRVTKNDLRFVYNGYLQIANHHSSTSHFNYYIWDPTEPIATRPLAWTTPTTNHESPITRFYTHGGNKNVSEVIASNNDVAAHYEYAPFGALTVSRGASAAANPWRFSSEYDEDETATVYYNYRHYEPVTGRWMCRDGIEERDSCNLYLFCRNNVIMYNDERGESIAGAAIGTTAVAAIIYAVAYCAKPQADYAHAKFSTSGDKFKHCWTSCRISKTCGGIIMELAGLGKEVVDRGLRVYCNKYPNSDWCLNNGTTPFWDSIEDLIANQQCAGWETFVFGAVGGWIGAAIREDCECCCGRKVGYDNGDV